MAILVTGGLGYVGCHAVKMLVDRGEEVVNLDNLARRNETPPKQPVLQKPGKPLSHRHQRPGHCGKCSYFLAAFSCAATPDQAYLHVPLVDVHTSAYRMHNSHRKILHSVYKTNLLTTSLAST